MHNKELHLAKSYFLETNQNLFITGKAGTGKTTFLKDVLSESKKKTIVVAPTGVAAINAGGITIHSCFQLPSATFLPNNAIVDYPKILNRAQLLKQQKLKKERIDLLRQTDTIIIDEISMVRADLMDAIDFTLRRVRKSESPFGGMQIVVLGDLFQLSPVVKDEEWTILKEFYKSSFFFSSLVWQRCNPTVISFKKVYRQEDQSFVELLNRIRVGETRTEDIDRINAQIKKKDHESEITLTTHNYIADGINKRKLDEIKSEVIFLNAKIEGQFYESSFPTLEQITIKKGAQVMFIKNHPEGLYYNGMLGVIEGYKKNLLHVKVKDNDTTLLIEKEEWKNVSYKVDKKTKEILKEERGSFLQFPIKLAWAVTVHKSQGLTFERVEMDLQKTFAPGQLYVALSRCKSLEGLSLLTPISEKNILINKSILTYYSQIANTKIAESNLEYHIFENQVFKLAKVFEFKVLEDLISEWKEYVGIKTGLPKKEIMLDLSILEKHVTLLVKTSQKFILQLKDIAKKENGALILERADAAIRYFTDQVNAQVILIVVSHLEKYKSDKKLNPYLRFVHTVESRIWELMDSLYSLEFGNEKIFKGNNRYKPSIGSSLNNKRKSGSTYETTLTLFKEGMSLSEIASVRYMSESTIARHLHKHLEEDQVSITDLLSKDKMDKIISYVQKNPNKKVTEVVNSIGFKVAYHEIRWVQLYLERLKVI